MSDKGAVMSRASDVVWLLGAAVVVVGATLLACIGLWWISAVTIAVIALVIWIASRREAQVILTATVGCISIISASSVFLPDDGSAISIGLRVVGSGLLLVSAFRAKSQGYSADPNLKRVVRRWAVALGVPVAVYIALATVPFGMWNDFLSYEVGVVLLCVVISCSAPQLASGTLQRSVIIALAATVIASIVMGFLLPEFGIQQGRLRGVVNNANLLGFYAFLLGVVALVAVKRTSARVVLLGAAAIALLWTASRASTLALIIAIVVLILLTRLATGLLVTAGLAILGIIVGLVWPSFLNVFEGVTRGNDSRSGSLDVALAAVKSNPWSGVGLGNEASIIASSPLRAAANGGIPGLIVVGILWVAILYTSARVGGKTLALGVAAVAHSCFEGWLLSPVGPMILIFALVWLTVAHSDLTSKLRTDPGPDKITSTRNKAASGLA